MARRSALAVALVALLGAGVWGWSRGLTGPYHFDDYVTPLNDPASHSLAAWRDHLTTTLRPLTKLSYAMEAEIPRAGTPAGRRVVSITLHAVSAGLLLLLIRALVPGIPPLAAAFMAAAWFVHPVHADAVLLASGRSAVLSNLIVLAALLANALTKRGAALLLFLLACLARETALAAVLPMGMLAARGRDGGWQGLRRLLPLAIAGAVVVIWILGTPRYVQLAEHSFLGRPLAQSAIAQVGAVAVGVGMLFRPATLSIDYGIALPSSLVDLSFLTGMLLYVSAVVAMLFCRRRAPAAAVGLALWLAAVLPTQSVVPKLDALTNRPLSLALAGLLLAAAPLVTATLAATTRAIAAARRRGFCIGSAWQAWATRGVAGLCATAVVGVLLATTVSRAALFESELQLWQDAAAKSRVNDRPLVTYALLLEKDGRTREALAALSTAAGINPFSSHIEAMTRALRVKEGRP